MRGPKKNEGYPQIPHTIPKIEIMYTLTINLTMSLSHYPAEKWSGMGKHAYKYTMDEM